MPPRKLGGSLGSITIASQLDAQRLALAAYLPTPALGLLFDPPGRAYIVTGGAPVHVIGPSQYQPIYDMPTTNVSSTRIGEAPRAAVVRRGPWWMARFNARPSRCTIMIPKKVTGDAW